MVNRLQPFYLLRKEDVTGVSGTGVVAVGAILPSGTAVIEWLSFESSINIYKNIEHVKDIHGHDGRTLVILGEVDHKKVKK